MAHKKPQWINLKCRECADGTIHILSSWTNTPRYCVFCKARRVDKKERALRVYFKNLRDKKKLHQEDQDELIYIADIEEKLDKLKIKYGNDECLIFEELIRIKKVRDILFSWDKHLHKSKAGSKRHKTDTGFSLNKNFTGFVQGGSPGLKR